MKAATYFFGNFTSGYTQYPDDNTRDWFSAIVKSRKGATELIYHREGALAYYAYVREISRADNTFIGMCYVFNGVLITDVPFLFGIFEEAVTNLAVNGELLEFANDGTLSSTVGQLYAKEDELQRVSDFLNSKLSSLGGRVQKLPPQNYSVSNTEWKTYSFDELDDIDSVIKNYSNIRIVKGENYDTGAMKSYAHKLKEQSVKIEELSTEADRLKGEVATLNHQKKQTKVVVFLLLFILIAGVVFYFYAQEKAQDIQNKSDEIYGLNEQVNNKNQCIYTLRQDSANLANRCHVLNDRLRDVYREVDRSLSEYVYFPSWSSTNKNQPNTTSYMVYSFYGCEGDVLQIPYYVSSEVRYDCLEISIEMNGGVSRELIVRESGVENGTCEYKIPASGSYQLTVSYTKDGSNDMYNDRGGVRQFYIYKPIVSRLKEMSKYE